MGNLFDHSYIVAHKCIAQLDFAMALEPDCFLCHCCIFLFSVPLTLSDRFDLEVWTRGVMG